MSPLTDKICEEIADTEDRPFTSIEMDNMRAAADWQLKQVVSWLEDNLRSSNYLQLNDDRDIEVNIDYVIQHLLEEMRS